MSLSPSAPPREHPHFYHHSSILDLLVSHTMTVSGLPALVPPPPGPTESKSVGECGWFIMAAANLYKHLRHAWH